MAEHTPITRAPAAFAATMRAATRRIFSGAATDVPPNFMTTVWTPAGNRSGAVSDIAEDCRDAPRTTPSFETSWPSSRIRLLKRRTDRPEGPSVQQADLYRRSRRL